MTNLKKRFLFYLFFVLLVIFYYTGCKPREKEPYVTPEQIYWAKTMTSLLTESEQALERGDFSMALSLVDSAETIAPDLSNVHFLRALIYEKLYRFEESLAAYEKVLSIDPRYRGANYNMGNNAFRVGQYRKSISYYWKEVEIGPRAGVYVNMGLSYANLYKADSAEWAYLQAIALDDTYANAYIRLGQLYKDDGEIEKAIMSMSRGVDLEPGNVNGLYLYGTLLLQTGQLEEAVRYLEKVKEKRPWDQGVFYSLGRAMLRLGYQEEGTRYLSKADTLQELQSKIDQQRSLTDLQPGNPINWVRMGNALYNAKRTHEATEAYKVALSINPENLPLQETIAYLCLSIGDTVQAISRYRAILQQDSTHAGTWFNLGVVYANTGNLNTAIRALERALEYNPNDTTIQAYIDTLLQRR